MTVNVVYCYFISLALILFCICFAHFLCLDCSWHKSRLFCLGKVHIETSHLIHSLYHKMHTLLTFALSLNYYFELVYVTAVVIDNATCEYVDLCQL